MAVAYRYLGLACVHHQTHPVPSSAVRAERSQGIGEWESVTPHLSNYMVIHASTFGYSWTRVQRPVVIKKSGQNLAQNGS